MSVSVVIPVFNEPLRRLNLTLDSVTKAIVENRDDSDEIIIVDDGSAGRFVAPLSPWVKTFAQEHRGIAAALNHGISRARNRWVCWVSSGDTIEPSKLRVQREWMESNGYSASFHDHRGEKGVVHRVNADWADRLETDNQFCGSTVMFDRELLAKLGIEFDEELRYCVDWDFACDVHFEGPGWAYLPEVFTRGWAAYEAAGLVEPYTSHTGRATDGEAAARRQQDRRRVMRRWRGAGLRAS